MNNLMFDSSQMAGLGILVVVGTIVGLTILTRRIGNRLKLPAAEPGATDSRLAAALAALADCKTPEDRERVLFSLQAQEEATRQLQEKDKYWALSAEWKGRDRDRDIDETDRQFEDYLAETFPRDQQQYAIYSRLTEMLEPERLAALKHCKILTPLRLSVESDGKVGVYWIDIAQRDAGFGKMLRVADRIGSLSPQLTMQILLEPSGTQSWIATFRSKVIEPNTGETIGARIYLIRVVETFHPVG